MSTYSRNHFSETSMARLPRGLIGLSGQSRTPGPCLPPSPRASLTAARQPPCYRPARSGVRRPQEDTLRPSSAAAPYAAATLLAAALLIAVGCGSDTAANEDPDLVVATVGNATVTLDADGQDAGPPLKTGKPPCRE